MIKNGNLLKEKFEYYVEQFGTQEGIIDFLLGSLIWGFIIVTYTQQIFSSILGHLQFITNEFFKQYAAYLVFGIFTTLLSIIVSTAIIIIFKKIKEVFYES